MSVPSAAQLRIQITGSTAPARAAAHILAPLLGRFQTETHAKSVTRVLDKCTYGYLPAEARVSIEDWTPHGELMMPPDAAAFVRDSVTLAAPFTAYTAKLCLRYTAQYVKWCLGQGYPLTAKVIWSIRAIDLYSTNANLDRTEGTRRNYRAVLMRISETVLPEAHPDKVTAMARKTTAAPYTAAEMAGFRDWAALQLTPLKEARAMLILLTCAGAGLRTQELTQLRPEHLRQGTYGTLIDVPGPRTRTVPVLGEWESWVDPLLTRQGGEELLWGPMTRRESRNLVSAFTQYSNGNPPRSDRLRNTWVVTHLTAGVPMKDLYRAAGVDKMDYLPQLLEYIAQSDDDSYQRLLRGEAQA